VPDDEVWKPYPIDERYQISNYGRVLGVYGNYIKIRLTKDGLPYFFIANPRPGRRAKVRAVIVSRAVLETFVGPPPEEDSQAAHLNKQISDNHIDNLEWQSPEQVQLETTAMGCHLKGEARSSSILTEELVREIRKKWNAGGVYQSELAKEYRVSPATISLVVNRKF
jgi:hypothetical protein